MTTTVRPAISSRASDVEGGDEGGAGGDADRQTFDPGAAASHVEGVIIADLDHLVDHLTVEDGGHEAAADPLDLVRSGRAAGEHRRGRRLDRDHPHRWFALLQHLADAGERAAGADAGDHGVDRPGGVVPDLLGGRYAMDQRIGRVLELLRHDRAGDFVEQCRGRVATAPAMPRSPGVSSSRAPSSFSILRRSSDMLSGMTRIEIQPLGGADEGEGDAGIAAGRLDDGRDRRRSGRAPPCPRSWRRRCGPSPRPSGLKNSSLASTSPLGRSRPRAVAGAPAACRRWCRGSSRTPGPGPRAGSGRRRRGGRGCAIDRMDLSPRQGTNRSARAAPISLDR